MLIDDLDVRVIHATTGEIIRTLTIDPNRRYHGTGAPPGPRKTRNRRTLNEGSAVSDVRDITWRNGRDSNPRALQPPAFKAGAIVRSATVPPVRLTAPAGRGRRAVSIPRSMVRLRTSQERCQRGRMGRPAKALTAARWSVGSNPTLSATVDRHLAGRRRPSSDPTAPGRTSACYTHVICCRSDDARVAIS